jgi:hypothetical protein
VQAYSDEKRRIMDLESKLDTTLHRSVELKEERIRVLEDRLGDALGQNQQLKDDAVQFKKQAEMLRQNAAQQQSLLVVSSPSGPRRNLPSHLNASAIVNGSPLARHSFSANALSADEEVAGARRTGEIVALQFELETLRSENARLAKQAAADASKAATESAKLSQTAELQASFEDRIKAARENNDVLAATNDQLKSKVKSLEKDTAKLRDRESQLNERVKMLTRFRETLEQENKSLMAQINKLLLQNQEMLFKTMSGTGAEEREGKADSEGLPERRESISIVTDKDGKEKKKKKKLFGIFKRGSEDKGAAPEVSSARASQSAPADQR